MKTEVRLRHADYADAISIGEIEFTDNAVTSALALLRRWGIQIPNSTADVYCGLTADICGQFVLDHEANQAYFEIIINDED
jgi:hypothetical protein